MSNPTLRFGHASFTLVGHLFRQMLAEHNVDTEAAESVSIEEFYAWSANRGNQHGTLFPDRDELLEAYHLAEEDLISVEHTLSNPFRACAKLFSWWPAITMAGRKPPTLRVTAIAMIASIAMEDGTTVHLPMPEITDETALTDGLIATLWRSHMGLVSLYLRNKGLDGVVQDARDQGSGVIHVPLADVD